MARPTLTQPQVDAFRSRATRVALELFVAEGYTRFSLRTLARELGCSHATPYRYFPQGRAEIFAAVRAEGFRRFADALRRSRAQSEDPEQQLRHMAQGYYDFANEQPAAFAVIFRMGEPAGQDDPELIEAAHDAWAVVMTCVGAAVEAHVIEGDVNEVAHTMWAGMHGVSCLQSARTLSMGRTAPEILKTMVDALLRAHRPHTASRQEPVHG